MANVIFNEFLEELAKGSFDLDANTLKISLHGATYRAIADETKRDSHLTYADLTDELATGGGYTSGGATLANVTITKDTTNNITKIDADDVSWTSFTNTPHCAVIRKSTGTPSTEILIGYIDFGGAQAVIAGTFTVQFHANGFLTFEPKTGS